MFSEAAVLYSLHPHAHFRGKSSSFVAHYPDGREETLINIPAYDFNWQSTYDLAKPLTKVIGRQQYRTQMRRRSIVQPLPFVRRQHSVSFVISTWNGH